MLKVNDEAPLFTLKDDRGEDFSLEAQRGHKVLLVFYPGDDTPVCTRQLCDYRDGIESFEGLGVQVVGISNDSTESHRRFRAKHDLPFTLLSDDDMTVAELYDSKGILGVKRSIFLVDEKGVIRYLHIETLAVFRRKRDELLEVIEQLA
ncbi:MAG: peroxiredoxin [Xanthomonadales bacterium]|nr:peroxiredoxin [Xanthomonadales bacterium]